jgi:hypothetical protein
MKIEQKVWTKKEGWSFKEGPDIGEKAQLVIIFAATEILKETTFLHNLTKTYPKAHIFGCSTSGEIRGTKVSDDTLVATAIYFEHTGIASSRITLDKVSSSREAGEVLAQSIKKDGLVHVFVLSDGLNVNGSELVKGLAKNLPEEVTITGGLAGNGDRFEETYVLYDDISTKNTVAILGLYGNTLKVGYGSMGGWDPFGPERLITKSKENVLYELDGKSGLEIYKKYLGEHAGGLPATGLLFPLSIRTKDGESGIVRTILSVNEKEQSMTFAGEIPEKAYARFMKANFERLIDGAHEAAKISLDAINKTPPDLAILISCVGRKLVLKQRIEEEVETIRDVLGGTAMMTGFYSYGEISPFAPGEPCALHNQTMTITTFTET